MASKLIFSNGKPPNNLEKKTILFWSGNTIYFFQDFLMSIDEDGSPLKLD